MMKVSLNWLREYVDISLAPDDLARKLTMAGIEAETVTAVGDSWHGITVGQIIAINPHPNADRLRLVTVDLGTEQDTVVCGALNLRLGEKVAFAAVGQQFNQYWGALVAPLWCFGVVRAPASVRDLLKASRGLSKTIHAGRTQVSVDG